MGAVFRPEDLGRDYRKMIENAVKDFSPNTRDNVIQLLYSWEGKTSGKKLAQILGQDKAEKLLKSITEFGDFSGSFALNSTQALAANVTGITVSL